jgi:hypothetical protein
VVEIINDKMVMIEVRGVKFPSYIDQIDFPYFKRFTQKPPKKKEKKFIDDLPKEKSKASEARVSEGMWLSLLPKFTIDEFGDEVVELFKLYLVNKTGRGYKFTYIQLFFGEEDFELINEITAFHDFYLHDISFSSFNDNPSFNFEFSLITPDKAKAEFFEASLKIKPKQLFQRIEEMKQKNEPTINYKLFEVYPDKVLDAKPPLSTHASNEYAIYEAKKAREHLEQPRSIIDLHMEKLTDDWQHMSNFEILTLQLKEFEKWYDLAVAHHLLNFTVIHGVGSGKLRDEIHEILKTRKEVKYFVNQYNPRFGYGATEIFFNT